MLVVFLSSTINEVIKTVWNFLLLFYEKTFHAPKGTKKHKIHKNATKQKYENANKQTKIKNALKKHLSGKKWLIRLFAFLWKVSTIEMLVPLNQ